MNDKTMYQLFIESLGLGELDFKNLIYSYVVSNSKKKSDIPIVLSKDDFESITNEVFLELLSRNAYEKTFEGERLAKSYLNMIVRNQLSNYLTSVLSPIKMVNPKGGESKTKGPALTNALEFRRGAFELDRDPYSSDVIEGIEFSIDEDKINEKDYIDEGEDDLLSFHVNPIFRGFFKEVMAFSRKRGLENLMRMGEGKKNQTGSSSAASYYGRIVSEKLGGITSIENETACPSRITKKFFPEVELILNQ